MNLLERLKTLLSEAEASPDSDGAGAESAETGPQYSQSDVDAAVARALQAQPSETRASAETRSDPAETRSDPAETRSDPAETAPSYSQSDVDAAVARALQKQPKPVVVPQPGHASTAGDPDISAMTQEQRAKYAQKLDKQNRGQRVTM